MNITIAPNQQAQQDFIKDYTSKECLYLGGYGSGKSWSLYRKHLILHMINKSPSLVVAPTYSDLFRISVPALQAALLEWGVPFKTFPNGGGIMKYPYIEVLGQPIYLISGNEPDRFVGFEVSCIAVDECARVKQSDIPMMDVPTLVRGRLRHPNAKVRQINWATTPEGTNSFCYKDFVENPSPDRKLYVGSTLKNSALPSDYIDSLKNSYSSRLQDAYLHGHFINASSNLQFWAFDRKFVSSDTCIKEDEGKAFLSTDENVSPIHCVFGRYTKDRIWVKGEIFIADNANVKTLVSKYNEADKKVDVFGDASINRRNTVGERFVDILMTGLKDKGYSATDKTSRHNPEVFATCEMVNKLFETDKIRIHPSAKEFVKQLENASYKPGTLDTLKTGGHDPHGCDAFRQIVWEEFRPGSRIKMMNTLF